MVLGSFDCQEKSLCLSDAFSKAGNWNLTGHRLPGHCEPVTDVTGVAISSLEVPLLVDKFRETAEKNGLYDDKSHGIRWRFPHQFANWFGMTTLFDAPASLCKFQFACLLSPSDMHDRHAFPVDHTMLFSQQAGAVRPIIFTTVGATLARP